MHYSFRFTIFRNHKAKVMTVSPAYKIKNALIILMLCIGFFATAQKNSSINGTVIDKNTNKKLNQATVTLTGTNISTVTNNDGDFILKYATSQDSNTLTINRIGYSPLVISTEDAKKSSTIKLEPAIINLDAISINTYNNPKKLLQLVLSKINDNYITDKTLMTSFYRETIKKRKRNVSLAEAVVNVYKQPYNKSKEDLVKMVKSRKSTDYNRLDTVALKLQGGPYNTLYGDVMKYPEYIFSPALIDAYDFSFENSTELLNRKLIVMSFKQKKGIAEPLYYGKLYIDSNSLALVKAAYSLNIENKKLASAVFVKRKPNKIKVEPTQIDYEVNYAIHNDKWYYSYSNAQLAFKVKKKKSLFNTTYTLSCEMAITDLKNDDGNINREMKFSKNTILADEASGFSDPSFWGNYNVIEPEKSIENAIKKIKKRLKKVNSAGAIPGQ